MLLQKLTFLILISLSLAFTLIERNTDVVDYDNYSPANGNDQGSPSLVDVDIIKSEGDDRLLWKKLTSMQKEVRRKPIQKGSRDDDQMRRRRIEKNAVNQEKEFPLPDPMLTVSIESTSANPSKPFRSRKFHSGREFWLNALKTLLLEFRQRHPELVKKRRPNGATEQQDNRIE